MRIYIQESDLQKNISDIIQEHKYTITSENKIELLTREYGVSISLLNAVKYVPPVDIFGLVRREPNINTIDPLDFMFALSLVRQIKIEERHFYSTAVHSYVTLRTLDLSIFGEKVKDWQYEFVNSTDLCICFNPTIALIYKALEFCFRLDRLSVYK